MKITEFIDKHPKLVFWIRFVFWVIFAAGLPFAFIAWRYDIFTAETKISLTGWGLIAVVILIVFAIYLIKNIYAGLKQGIAKQCIAGVVSVILPLCALYMLINSAAKDMEAFKQALGCVILCEACAIPINPLPTWAYEKQSDMEESKRKSAADYLLDGFFSRKEKK